MNGIKMYLTRVVKRIGLSILGMLFLTLSFVMLLFVIAWKLLLTLLGIKTELSDDKKQELKKALDDFVEIVKGD